MFGAQQTKPGNDRRDVCETEMAAGAFGVIVVSHGAGGMALLHRDLGMALGSQGYVVAAPTHARGQGNDVSGVEVWVGRPKQVSRVIDVERVSRIICCVRGLRAP